MKWLVLILFISSSDYVDVIDTQSFEIESRELCEQSIKKVRVDMIKSGIQVHGSCVRIIH